MTSKPSHITMTTQPAGHKISTIAVGTPASSNAVTAFAKAKLREPQVFKETTNVILISELIVF